MAFREEGITNNFLEDHLVHFIHLLRQAGVKISNAETIDSLQGLAQGLDLSRRNSVKAALRSLLVKSSEEIKIFNSLFELYFQPLEKKQAEFTKLQKEQEEEAIIQAEQSLFTQAWALPSHSFFTRRQLLSPDAIRTYVELPPALKKEIKLQLNRAVVQGKDLGVVSAEIIKSLQDWEEAESKQGKKEGSWGQVIGDLAPVSQNLRQRDLGKLSQAEMEKMQVYIEKMGKKLAVLLSNRFKMTSKHQKLDLRRTIRKNISYGGTIFKLIYRNKKISKPRISLFCDVSGSMANYSIFTLQLLYGMQQAIEEMESFLFGTDLERITPYFEEKNQEFSQVLMRIRENSFQWRGGTALGASLSTFFRRWPECVDNKTTVIIISDGATRDPDAALVYLQRLQEQVKSLLWLNPRCKEEWETTSSKMFQEYFPMFECRNIQQLEQAVTNEFFR